MDVVRRNIEALRGKIDIRSTVGKGTIFSMRLPLTMAIIDGMVVRVGHQRYVIPTLSIERSFRPQPKDLHTVVGKGEMVMVRGGLLPIHRLNHVLGHDLEAPGDLLIVVESQDARACLAADEIIGQQQVVIKTLGQATQSIRGVSGGAILGDGRVALILDVGGILNEATAIA
jgi:two-component system chemotaxis sensor kinase CheA